MHTDMHQPLHKIVEGISIPDCTVNIVVRAYLDRLGHTTVATFRIQVIFSDAGIVIYLVVMATAHYNNTYVDLLRMALLLDVPTVPLIPTDESMLCGTSLDARS